jgi:uncharacterized protein
MAQGNARRNLATDRAPTNQLPGPSARLCPDGRFAGRRDDRLLRVGGGFVIVSTLAVELAISMRMAVGTSLVIITATSLMALGAHLAAGRTLDVGVTAAMTVSATAGALAGVRLADRVPQRHLGQGFAALVVVVAAYLLISAALLGGPPGTT